MRKWNILVGIALLLLVCGCEQKTAPEKTEGQAPSAPVASLAGMSGVELFQNAALGTSGKSCNSCHPDGDRLSGVGDRYPQEMELENMINRCVSGPLKGKELGMNSPEMKALAGYLRSL